MGITENEISEKRIIFNEEIFVQIEFSVIKIISFCYLIPLMVCHEQLDKQQSEVTNANLMLNLN